MKDKLASRLLFACVLSFIVLLSIPSGVQASDWDWQYVNESIAAGDWWYFSEDINSGVEFSGYVETASESQTIDFFICNEYNYNEWSAGRSATGYEEALNVHTTQFSLVVPSDDTWYAVVSNADGSSSVTFDIGLDEGGDSSPVYSTEMYTTTVYGETLEPNWHYYVYDTYDAGTTLYGHVSTWFSYDGVDVFFCDETNYDIWYSGGSATRYSLVTDMHTTTIGDFEVPYDGVWYLVIHAAGEADTLTISFGFDYALAGATTTPLTTTGTGGAGPLSAQDLMILGVVGIVAVVGLAAVMIVRSHKHGVTPQTTGVGDTHGAAKVLVVCPYCGGKNEQGMLKCGHCGAEI